MTRSIFAAGLLALCALPLPALAQDATGAVGAKGTEAEAAAGAAMDGQDAVPQTAETVALTATFRASDLIGSRIHAVAPAGDNVTAGSGQEAPIRDLTDGYDDIGEIDDLLLDDQGKLVGVLAEVGGFLGLGDKMVLLGLDEIRVAVSEGGPFYVTDVSRDSLDAREAVDEDIWED